LEEVLLTLGSGGIKLPRDTLSCTYKPGILKEPVPDNLSTKIDSARVSKQDSGEERLTSGREPQQTS